MGFTTVGVVFDLDLVSHGGDRSPFEKVGSCLWSADGGRSQIGVPPKTRGRIAWTRMIQDKRIPSATKRDLAVEWCLDLGVGGLEMVDDVRKLECS